MQARRLDVVGEELGVVGAQELLDLGRELGADAPRPERHAGASLRSRAARELDLERGDPDEALGRLVRERLARRRRRRASRA